jgi:hypothetical protein
LKRKPETEAHFRFFLKDKVLSIRKFRQELVYFEAKSINSVSTKNNKNRINDQFTAFSAIQILCNNLLNNQKFIKSFIKAEQKIHKIWYPMPREWIDISNKDEVIANRFICNLLWKFYCLKKYLQLLINVFKYCCIYLIYNPIKFGKNYINFYEKYVYVGNFYSNLSEIGDFNFINWFKKREKCDSYLFIHCNNEFRDSKKVIFHPNFLMPTSAKDRAKLFILALRYMKHYILSPELKYGFNLNIEDLFRTYFLLENYESLNNIFIFREEMRLHTPIWVRYAHSLNQRVIYVEQSQWIEPDIEEGRQMDDDFEKLVIWPEVWTVTEERILFLQKHDENKKKIYRYAGLPWMHDLTRPILDFEGISIAVFDVEPHQGYFGVSTYNLFGLNEIRYSVTFLEDIVECANEFGFKVFHKPKRNIAAKRFVEYQQLLENLTTKFPKNYMLLKPETSIKFIAENTNFVIATPFTSAIYGGEFSNTSCIYYDPLETGISSSRNSVIEVIHGRKALSQWFNQINGV